VVELEAVHVVGRRELDERDTQLATHAEELNRREAELATRERVIAQRERERAEQALTRAGDQGIAAEKRRLERAYRALQQECGRDRALFARLWHDVVRGWRFDPTLNDLIEQHNEWYPVERRLPMNPRTGDYVPVGGRSYRRPVLGPEWVLEHFPASPPAGV